MNLQATSNDPRISLTDRKQVDQACDRFEAAWRAGGEPDLAHLASGLASHLRAVLVRELVLLERELRRERGEEPGIRAFAERYPEYREVIESVFDSCDFRSSALTSLIGVSSSCAGVECLECDGSELGAAASEALRTAGFEVLGELGRGGMGVVVKARQTSLGRLVAVKLIKPGSLISNGDRLMFQNEAEAVARLDHPHIVPIYEVGERDGFNFFSMKLIAGTSLEKNLAQFTAHPRAAGQLVKVVAEAIHHAHQRGILHRDLKPSNILVDEHGEPHVTDFGLAKRMDRADDMNQPRGIAGTPAYMSPEQAQGDRGAVTIASDVYGLGSILYSLLVGKAPFTGSSVSETLELVRERLPDAPSKLNPRVPRDLEKICLKCLEKDPERRYGSAQELAHDLWRWLRGEPTVARPAGAARQSWMWCRRNPVVAALSALCAGAVVSGVAGVTALWLDADHQRAKAETIIEFLNKRLLAQASTELNPVGAGLRVVDLLDRTSAVIGGSFAPQPEVEASIRETIGTSYLSLGQYAKAEPHLRSAVRLDTELYGPNHRATLRAQNHLGALLDATGRAAEAGQVLRRNLTTSRRVLGSTHETTLEAAGRLGTLLWHRNQLDEAEALLRECVNTRRTTLREGHPDTLRSMYALSSLLKDRGRYHEAERLAYQYAQGVRCGWGPKHPENIPALLNQAAIMMRQGNRFGAEATARQAVDESKRILGADHPTTLNALNECARAFREVGRRKDAEQAFRECLAARVRVEGEESLGANQSRIDLGALLREDGDTEEANPLLKQAWDVGRSVRGLDDAETQRAAREYLRALAAVGKQVEAEQVARAVFGPLERLRGSQDPITREIQEFLETARHAQ